ncbi:C-type mannose receptor 2-like [Amphiura filiformis]|uniref:C-type mannose receptor 2-like n=1 Tax=Amphiura filiformis TaxID=82378 RepID=UPI003B21CB23
MACRSTKLCVIILFGVLIFPHIHSANMDCTLIDSRAFGDAYGTKCYFTDLRQNPWATGAEYCSTLDLSGYNTWSLINPRNAEEEVYVKGMMKEKGALHWSNEYYTQWWIGQNDAMGEQQYVNIDTPDGCPGVFLDWYTTQPDTDGEDQDCIVFRNYQEGSFHDTPCTYTYGTLCKTVSAEPLQSCATLNRLAFQNPSDSYTCYLADATSLRTFAEAEVFCNELSTTVIWHVADVFTQAEIDFLKSADLDVTKTPYYWVGQNDMAEELVFQYLNPTAGCPSVYVHWTSDQPDGPKDDTITTQQDCIVLQPGTKDATPSSDGTVTYSGGGFQDDNCATYYYIMCEMSTTAAPVTEAGLIPQAQASTAGVTTALGNY